MENGETQQRCAANVHKKVRRLILGSAPLLLLGSDFQVLEGSLSLFYFQGRGPLRRGIPGFQNTWKPFMEPNPGPPPACIGVAPSLAK